MKSKHLEHKLQQQHYEKLIGSHWPKQEDDIKLLPPFRMKYPPFRKNKPFCNYIYKAKNFVCFYLFGQPVYYTHTEDVPNEHLAQPDYFYHPSDQLSMQGYIAANLINEDGLHKIISRHLDEFTVQNRLITHDEYLEIRHNYKIMEKLAK